MNHRYVRRFFIIMALVATGVGFGLDHAIGAGDNPAVVAQGEEVLTRGPVHEAFAETVTFDPEPGIIVPKAPPAAIEEVPPEQKPQGDNVAWIPGYWGWDGDRDDFIWISGIWRALPPGRQWVPGYWAKAPQGFQWTSGYWADSGVRETEYLPEPPATVEIGPNINAPSPDYGWIPGSWVWYGGRYAWRPGYWAAMQPNWIWVPDYYVWTPRGYVFVDGYWDYPVVRRGILFAPVYFSPGVRIGFYFSPSVVVDLSVFADSLFFGVRYNHYYFGDYYAPRYYDKGIFPWFSLHARRYGYDPIYAHERWEHRNDRDWEHRIQTEYRNRREHEEARPGRRMETPGKVSTTGRASKGERHAVVRPFDQVTKRGDSSWRFQSTDNREREQTRQQQQELRRFRDQRQVSEAKAPEPSAGRPSQTFEAARVRQPSSPIMGRSAEQFGKNQRPPRRYEAPKPDSNVEPVPRRGGGDRYGAGRPGGGGYGGGRPGGEYRR